MPPKCKGTGAGNLVMLKRSRKVHPLSKKMKVLNIRKKPYSEVAKTYSKKKFSVCEIVNEGKEICASFTLAPQTAKMMATVCNKCLAETEKACSLWIEDMNGKYARKH